MLSSVHYQIHGTLQQLGVSIRCASYFFTKEALLRTLTQEALYLTYGNINILTDVGIILLPIAILWDVQIKPSQKRAVFSAFVIRIV